MPKISVILPAYNAEKYIKEALDSILSQTFADFELIVLNDCSQDCTEEIILAYEDPRIVYVKNKENLGVAGTLNKGLALAKGEYIARMDADDISLRSRFEKQAAYLDKNPAVAVVGCAVERFSDEKSMGSRIFACTPEEMEQDLFFSCGLAHPGVMMRWSVVNELGGYDRSFEGLEDYELWCRVEESHGIAALPEVLLRYRIHGMQVTQNPSEKYRQRMTQLKRRQLEKLGLPTEGEQAECFYDYCLSKRPATAEQVTVWLGFLGSVAEKKPKMKNYLRKVAMDSLVALPVGSAMAARKGSKLISGDALMLEKGKRMVKEWCYGKTLGTGQKL